MLLVVDIHPNQYHRKIYFKMISKFVVILSIAVASCWFFQDSTASHVSLYEHADHQGERWSATNFHGCRNVDGWFNDRASSIDTHNGCVQLCEHGNCEGECRTLAPGIGIHEYLEGFNDKISSVRSC